MSIIFVTSCAHTWRLTPQTGVRDTAGFRALIPRAVPDFRPLTFISGRGGIRTHGGNHRKGATRWLCSFPQRVVS